MVPFWRTFRRTFRPDIVVGHSSNVLPLPHVAKGKSLKLDSGTDCDPLHQVFRKILARSTKTYSACTIIMQLRESGDVILGIRIVPSVLVQNMLRKAGNTLKYFQTHISR